MIKTATPIEVLEHFKSIRPMDHHFTGPPSCQQRENEGSVSHQEGAILAALAYALGGPVLEIGADLGISTRYIHEGLDQRGRPCRGLDQIISVDYNHKWPEDPAWPRRYRVEADSRDGHPLIGRFAPYTLVFIDGDHTYAGATNDLISYAPLGQLVVVHDTRPDIPIPTNPSNGSEARRATIDYAAEVGEDVWDIPTACGLMLLGWGGPL